MPIGVHSGQSFEFKSGNKEFSATVPDGYAAGDRMKVEVPAYQMIASLPGSASSTQYATARTNTALQSNRVQELTELLKHYKNQLHGEEEHKANGPSKAVDALVKAATDAKRDQADEAEMWSSFNNQVLLW